MKEVPTKRYRVRATVPGYTLRVPCDTMAATIDIRGALEGASDTHYGYRQPVAPGSAGARDSADTCERYEQVSLSARREVQTPYPASKLSEPGSRPRAEALSRRARITCPGKSTPGTVSGRTVPKECNPARPETKTPATLIPIAGRPPRAGMSSGTLVGNSTPKRKTRTDGGISTADAPDHYGLST